MKTFLYFNDHVWMGNAVFLWPFLDENRISDVNEQLIPVSQMFSLNPLNY